MSYNDDMSASVLTRLEVREETASDERLLNLFCNHLSLGQWEAARLCLRGLAGTRLPLRDILLGLVANPEAFRYAFRDLVARKES